MVLVDESDATPSSSLSLLGYQPSKVYRNKGPVCQPFSLLTAVGFSDLFAAIVGTLQTKPVCHPDLETLGLAIVDFFKSTMVEKDSPLQMILMYCISQLKFSICSYNLKVLVVPTNNNKSIRLNDCMEPMSFMKHPTKVQH